MQGRSQDTVLGQGPRVMGTREGKLREDVTMIQASLGPGRRQGASLGQHDPWTLLEEGKGEPGNKCVLASGAGGRALRVLSLRGGGLSLWERASGNL